MVAEVGELSMAASCVAALDYMHIVRGYYPAYWIIVSYRGSVSLFYAVSLGAFGNSPES